MVVELPSEDAPEPEPVVAKTRWWRRTGSWLWQLVAGHDVFISYSRADALGYAKRLRELLSGRRVSTFLDEPELEAGSVLPARIGRAARRSSVLVLIATPGAVERPDWLLTELGHAERSLLRPAIVPIVIPPLRPGKLPAPFARLNDHRMLEGSLDTGPPPSVVEELLGTMKRRRLIWKRLVAVLVLAAIVTAAAIASRLREASTRRALEAQRWSAVARRAASEARHDVAEYATARALEADPSARGELRTAYRDHRVRRMLSPLGRIDLGAQERVIGVASFGADARAITGDDAEIRLRHSGHTSPAIACPSASHVVQCDPAGVVVACSREVITLSPAGQVIGRLPAAGSIADVACVGGELRVLEERDRMLRVLHLRADLTTAGDPEPLVGQYTWMDSGLCRGGGFSAFKARPVTDALIIERGGPDIQGGLGAVRARIDRSGLATASVIADELCDRFFVEYSRADFTAPTRAASTEWLVMEWNPGWERDLSPTISKLLPLPSASGYYAAYLTRGSELALLPLTDMVIREIKPKTVATGVAALAYWDGAADGQRARTVSLEAGALAIRENGDLMTRRLVHVAEPSRILTGDRRDVVAVEGSDAAELWRRAEPVEPAEVPPSSTIATELGFSPVEIEAIEAMRAAE